MHNLFPLERKNLLVWQVYSIHIVKWSFNWIIFLSSFGIKFTMTINFDVFHLQYKSVCRCRYKNRTLHTWHTIRFYWQPWRKLVYPLHGDVVRRRRHELACSCVCKHDLRLYLVDCQRLWHILYPDNALEFIESVIQPVEATNYHLTHHFLINVSSGFFVVFF